RHFLYLCVLVLNTSASNEVEFLLLGHSSPHMDKDSLLVEEGVQGIHFTLGHPAPLFFGEAYYFLFRLRAIRGRGIFLFFLREVLLRTYYQETHCEKCDFHRGIC